jgi:methionyl-tRNA formyltransferase
MRLIFMGTPEIAVPSLERLIEHGHEVLAVFSQPDRPVGRHHVMTPPPTKVCALSHSLPVYQPEKIRTDEVREVFQTLAPDAMVLVAYGKIIPPWLLAVPRLGCINVHFSLLPKYRGAAPVNWAIARGEQVTGITTMFMDEGLDTGPVLLQRECPVGADETAPELAEKLAPIGAELLVETLRFVERGQIVPQAQDHSQATLAPMLKREDGLIDWRWTAADIHNRVRGFHPWPGAWTTLGGHRVIVWKTKCALESGDAIAHPGAVARLVPDGVLVTCGDGSVLRIEELQLEGKRRMIARDFLNGTHLTVGQHFGAQP